jgi:hypothetical protein
MSIERLTYEPSEFAIGESLAWSKSFADYSAADGWTLTYYFRGPTNFDVVGTANGTKFDVNVATTVTANASAGVYFWQAWLSKGADKIRADSGRTTAVAGFPTVSAPGFDGKSDAEKLLDAIDALLEGKATVDQQEYTIGAGGAQQQLRKIPIPDLLELRKHYAAIVAGERRKRNRRGLGRTIRVQFDPPRS